MYNKKFKNKNSVNHQHNRTKYQVLQLINYPGCKEYRKVDSTARWRHIVTSSSISWQCSDVIGGRIYKKINGITDDYRNNSFNFEAKLMRLSHDIHNFITEIVDIWQQFAEGYCFVTVTVIRSKKSFRY